MLIEVQKPLADQKGYETERDKRTERAIQEVALMQSLRGNPNIVECYDYEVQDWEENDGLGRDLLIRMELLCSLQEHLKFSITDNDAEVIRIGKDICKALIACHERNILHRDIKTGNILWNENGRNYKLGDFGISRYVESGALASTIGIGTDSYVAPEQILGLGKGYDHRADIYSLGLVLYQLSNENRMPFAQTIFVTMAEVEQRLAGNSLPNPCKAGKELCNIILKACAYKPDQRYQSAQEFYDILCAVSAKKTSDDENVHATVLLRGGINYKNETVPLKNPADLDTKNRLEPEKNKLFQWFSKIVSTVNPNQADKQYRLGYQYYLNGNKIEAVKWYRKAAEQNHADAQYNLGNCYYLGKGVKQDYAEAAKWYRRYEEQTKSAYIQDKLGDCYYAMQNYAEAAKWFRKAEEQENNALRHYKLGGCYYAMQDYAETVEWLRKSAAQGNADAQYNLGNCYYLGKGVKQDYAEATKWYRRNEEQTKDKNAQYWLGRCYYHMRDYMETVKWYHKAAEQNHADAQYQLGYCYNYGWGVTRDEAEAERWHKKAIDNGKEDAKKVLGQLQEVESFRRKAAQGNADAQYNLGNCYYLGKGVKQDYAEAAKWYRRNEEQTKSASIQDRLGDCYYAMQDYTEAVKWYRKSAEQDWKWGQHELGRCYEEGKGVKQDYAEAVKWYRKAAEQNHADAQYQLGYCYYYGWGVTRDEAEAEKWYKRAIDNGKENAKKALEQLQEVKSFRRKAEQGDADIQYNLGERYYWGWGVTKDYAEAAKWYREAAEQNHADAQYQLGYCYNYGWGVTKDYAEAVKWYRKAAEQSHIDAQYELGNCYRYGRGVAINDLEAVKWYREAAEQNHTDAQYQLGYCYFGGWGVTKDYAEAVKWYRKAAEQNHAEAQYQLGHCYFDGWGVTKDYTKAEKWYKRAMESESEYLKGKVKMALEQLNKKKAKELLRN